MEQNAKTLQWSAFNPDSPGAVDWSLPIAVHWQLCDRERSNCLKMPTLDEPGLNTMDKQNTQSKYQQILVQEAERQSEEAAQGGAERRGAPRVSVVCGDMAVNSQVPVSPVNLSVSGACFFAERPFPIGSHVEMSIATVFTLQATVVNCVMEESSSELMECHYRVHCQFDDESEGLELLVLAKEREYEM